MDVSIRRSRIEDLEVLLRLEEAAFPYYQQSPKRTLDLSLKSSFQQVWIAEIHQDGQTREVGSMVLYLYKKTIRIFSIAVLQEVQGNGIGKMLLEKAAQVAGQMGAVRLSLEVDSENSKLVKWYKKAGFEEKELLTDYYKFGRDGLRMVKHLPQQKENSRISNIIVVDDPKSWILELDNVEVVSSRDYTTNKGMFSERALRVFNLCNSYKYQSIGYYVSLLASAREHRSIPTVTTIRDFRDIGVIQSIADDIDDIIQKSLRKNTNSKLRLNVYFGQTVDGSYKTLGQKLYQMFEAPMFQVHFSRVNSLWFIKKIIPLSMSKVPAEELETIQTFAKSYFEIKRFQRARLKNYKYYLAVLVNPTEQNPPSDKRALSKLEEAADDLDIYTEFITKEDYNRLSEFDALFIRETTNVNDYTYQFSRKAYAEGLAVMDDPWSILRCSNKIYLHERLRMNTILTPETTIYMKGRVKTEALEKLKYPIILKKPDSAFSMGVAKVLNPEEMSSSLECLFKTSDLVIAQEFLPSDYDWRIGVLDNQPLFACKYFMAKDHWQIYNWKGEAKNQSGGAVTVPLQEVPQNVLNTATRAAALMGDGLYGVDLKMLGEKVYVIEVNDNPNIDAGIEDKIAGKELYNRIVQSLITRIEMSRTIERFVSIEPD